MMITKKLFKVTLGMTAVASLLSLMGCAAGPKGIAIVELDTMDKRKVRPWGDIISVKDDCFYGIQYHTDSKLILRAFNFRGKIKKEVVLPVFDDLIYTRNKAVSDDGSRFVSFVERNRAIKMVNLSDNSVQTLLPEAGKYGRLIREVEFLSDDEILIALDRNPDFDRDKAQILKYHIPSESLDTVKTMSRLNEVSLSPSHRFLAFTNHPIHNNLAILDLDTGDIVASQINEHGTRTGHFSWSPDETKIAYYISSNDTIYVYDITKEESSVVRQFDEDVTCYDLFFTDNEHLICSLGSEEGTFNDESPVIINIDSGEIVQTIDSLPVWGGLFVADGGKRIIYIYK